MGRSESVIDYEEYWTTRGHEDLAFLLPSLRELLAANVGPADSCVDVGCGRGQGVGAWLDGHAGSYVGVDVSEEALAVARRSGLQVQKIDDAADLPFQDDSFTVATCVEVLEHLIDPAAAAREILRVLRPGGLLIATVPNAAHWRRRADLALLGRWNPLGDAQSAHRPWRDPHLRFFARRNLGAMLSEAGFEPVVTGGHGGSWLIDFPVVRRLARGTATSPGPVFGRLVERWPGLFAHHLHAVARKPA